MAEDESESLHAGSGGGHDAQVPVSAGDLRHRLFVQVSIPPRRDASEEARYRAANRYAARYCGHLQRRYLRAGAGKGERKKARPERESSMRPH